MYMQDVGSADYLTKIQSQDVWKNSLSANKAETQSRLSKLEMRASPGKPAINREVTEKNEDVKSMVSQAIEGIRSTGGAALKERSVHGPYYQKDITGKGHQILTNIQEARANAEYDLFEGMQRPKEIPDGKKLFLDRVN